MKSLRRHLTPTKLTSTLRPLLLLLFGFLSSGIDAKAQTSTSVENLSSVPASTVSQGLGFNLGDIRQEWHFQMAQAAGATEVRMQPGWNSVENMAGVLALPPASETALEWCKKYGLRPLLVAGYGPPYRQLGTFSVAKDYPAGATTIEVTGDVSSILVPYCHVTLSDNQQLVSKGKWAYCGGLITETDPEKHTITLAAATDVPLTAGEPLRINKLLYPSVATADPQDKSIQAYGRYVSFLAERIAAHGLTGRVEIWNEPPWAHDPWDHRGAFYDHVPPEITAASPNFGIAAMIASFTPPAGVRYNWGGSHKSGFRSLLSKNMYPVLTAEQVAASFSSESFHPYSNVPEDSFWDPGVLAALPEHGNWISATLPGGNDGSNFKYARQLNLQKAALNFKQNITETGCDTDDGPHKARYTMRQYLGFLALGMERVTFFVLASSSGDHLNYVDPVTKAPSQAYLALQGLLTHDLKAMPAEPVAYTPADLPTVPAYSGTFPLTTLSIVGRSSVSAAGNIIDYVVWQRSQTPPEDVSDLAGAVSPDGKVTLKWRPKYATACTVKRGAAAGGPYEIIAANLPASKNQFVDHPGNEQTSAYYVVTEVNPGGESGNSNEVGFTREAGGTLKNLVHDSTTAATPVTPAKRLTWMTMASPPATPVTVHLPPGTTATSAWNLDTREPVPVTNTAGTATYAVSDDPVCLQVVPVAEAAQPAGGGAQVPAQH